MRQRKGSSICALPNTRRCKPRWQLPLCSTFSLFFSRCREPSLVSDAECVFAVYVQGDWSSYFRTGTGMEEQSFALIANLNTFFFFLALASADLPLNMKQGHGTSACLGILTAVLRRVLDEQGRLSAGQPGTQPISSRWQTAGLLLQAALPALASPRCRRGCGGASWVRLEQGSCPMPHLWVARARRGAERLFG